MVTGKQNRKHQHMQQITFSEGQQKQGKIVFLWSSISVANISIKLHTQLSMLSVLKLKQVVNMATRAHEYLSLFP